MFFYDGGQLKEKYSPAELIFFEMCVYEGPIKGKYGPHNYLNHLILKTLPN